MSKIQVFLFSSFLSFFWINSIFADPKEPLGEKLEPYLSEILPLYKLRGITYFYKDSTNLITGGVGTYSFEDNISISKKSLFPLGDFSRFLLNLCFFRLEKMGKVNLENPISLYFSAPSSKEFNSITIRNLLESTASFNYRNDEILFAEYNTWILSFKEREADLVLQLQSLDKSDRSFKSVLESLVLIEILKQITKSNYIDFVKKEINIPLNVNFIFELQKAKKKGLVCYTNFFNSISKINNSKYNKFVSPAIQIYGSIEDVVKIIDVIMDSSSDFISKENKSKLFNSNSYYEDSESLNYSFGFINEKSNNESILNIKGEGCSGVIRIFKSNKTFLIVLTNYEAGDSIQQFSASILSFIMNDQNETYISSNNERLVSLVGLALISISVIMFILHAFFMNEYFSIDNELILNKSEILLRFLFSLGSFLIILWIRFLFLPSLDSMSQYTMRFDSSSINGWKIELYFGFIAILFVTFVSSVSHGIILSKFNEK
jgi:CubicO group peptidase (beta-lactamase class C family)